MSERFDPRIHSLDYASKRLDELSKPGSYDPVQDPSYLALTAEQEEALAVQLSQAIDGAAERMLASGYKLPPVPQPTLNEADRALIRSMIETALDKVFCPEQSGLIDVRHFAHVTMTTDTGEQWRGMVYPVERTE
jgi:hypothetical protein